MSDPMHALAHAYERQLERLGGCDDVTCPNEDCVDFEQPIHIGHSCDGCGWSTADDFDAALDAADLEWKTYREERLADDGKLWEGE